MDPCIEETCTTGPLQFEIPTAPAPTEPVAVVPVPLNYDGLADTGVVSGDLLLPGVLLILAGIAMVKFRLTPAR